MLVYDEKVPWRFCKISIVAGVLPSRDSEIKGAIVKILMTNAILKLPVNKLFPIKYTYHGTNQIDKAREQKLQWEAAVNCVKIKREEFLNIKNINHLIRFDKTREIFPSITRVLNVLLTAGATSANVERLSSKERVPKARCLILATSYAQRWALCSNNPLMSKCLWSGWKW